MDDPQKKQNQQSPQVVQTPQSITSGGKETSPLPALSSSEWVSPSNPEAQISQELKEHGIEAKPVAPVLPNDVKQAGVKVAKDATPVTIAQEEEALGINTSPSILVSIKQAHKNVKDSVRWLAELIGLAQRKRDSEIEKGGKD